MPRLQVKTPFKKRKGAALTDEQEEFNRQLGAIRVRAGFRCARSAGSPAPVSPGQGEALGHGFLAKVSPVR